MIQWNLKPILEARGITRYVLSKRSGVAMNTVYAMYDGRTERPNLETLNNVLEALRALTGEELGVGDVLKYTPKN